MDWALLIFYIILVLVGLGFIMHRLAYRRKAVFIKLDTDQEGTKAVPFVEKLKGYRVIRKDGKTKVHVPGFKERIPFTENHLNPSHHKHYGAVIVQHGDNYYFSDVVVDMIEKDEDGKVIGLKTLFKPIPYNQRVNYAEGVKAINKKFTLDKMYIIAGGIVVVAMVVAFLIIYFTTDHMQGIIASANGVASQLETVAEQIGGKLIPN